MGAGPGASMRERGAMPRGQILVLFAMLLTILVGMSAFVIDIAWIWSHELRVQRAADAAALAGVVHLPGDATTAVSSAHAESRKNGYRDGFGGIDVDPSQDTSNPRRMVVEVSAPVDTFFMRLFGIDRVTVTRTSKAEYVLPVPMGSPQNYYGVGHFVGITYTSSDDIADTGMHATGLSVTGGGWTDPDRAFTQNSSYATESTSGDQQQWRQFGLLTSAPLIPNDATLLIRGIEVRLNRAFLTGSGASTSCQIRTEISWNGGTSWSTPVSQILNTTSTQVWTLGSSSSTAIWGTHGWTRNEFSDTNFRVRLTFLRSPLINCALTRVANLDQLQVRVTYQTTTTSSTTGTLPVFDPNGAVLAPQNFWGAMQSQGAPSIQGDAFMTKYEIRKSDTNNASGTDPDAFYASDQYYNYGVEFPAGSSSGEVWIYDPGFCDVSTSLGTGENWTTSAAYGSATRVAVSAFYDLYNTSGTPYNDGDDTLVANSGTTFRQSYRSDTSLGGWSGANTCQGLAWHNGWWRLATGLSGGATYRLHTNSTDTGAPTDQDDATGLNAFAIWSSASGGTPRVYGIGAMEGYVRLPGGQQSEFYMAKIESVHAGKTMIINLWDPGDTGSLSASLQILQPTASAYTPVTFSYTASRGSNHANASSCNSASGTNVTSVTTNTGGTSLFNGCWLTISIDLPSSYTAPNPASDTVTTEGGWWKIRYAMGGSASSFSTDLTTWKVDIRGNPVHLIVP